MRQIIDQKVVRRNREKARYIAVQGADFLLERALDDLVDRLAATTRKFSKCLYVGPAAKRVASCLLETGKIGTVESRFEDGFPDDEVLFNGNDDAPGYDLVVTLFLLHETNDTPGVLIQLNRLMAPDGLLIACFAGAGTLGELRDSLLAAESDIRGGAPARILPFMDVRDAGGLLQRAHFAMPVADSDELMVRYQSISALFGDLRAMGAGNSLIDRCPIRRDVLQAAFAYYDAHHTDADGRFRATFNLIWMSGWSPGKGQPKPAKPGSAQVSLADVLKSE